MVELTLLFIVFYYYHMLGITIGYHRLLSHRSFDCPKAVEYFFVIAGYLAFQSSPVWWATVHRGHHRFVDTAKDPHSPRYGMFRSFIGWVFRQNYAPYCNPQMHSKDLVADPFYNFLEQDGDLRRMHALNSCICLSSRLLLFFIFGWKIALVSLMAGSAAQVMPFVLNFICHIPALGYRNFANDDDSVNVWWVAILTTGEGWHNNHHKTPGSAKSGLKWFEIDLAWMVIRALEQLEIVSRTNVHPQLQSSTVKSTWPVSKNLLQ